MPYDNTPAQPEAPDAASSFRGWGTGSADLGRQTDFASQVSDFMNAGTAGQSQTGMPAWRPMGLSASGDGASAQAPTLHPVTLDRVQDFLSGGQRIPPWTGAPTWNWSGLSSPGATGTQSPLSLTGAPQPNGDSGEHAGKDDLTCVPYGYIDAETTVPASGPYNSSPSAAERAQARVDYARSQLGSTRWTMEDHWYSPTKYWKCNEFVAAIHRNGDPCGSSYPTLHREGRFGLLKDISKATHIGEDMLHNYTNPTVTDLANPEFEKDKLEYLDVKNAQPGDIIVWHIPNTDVHHSAIYVGDGKVIHANAKEIVEKPLADVHKGVQPIVRRYN
ncbi:hypothetical protein JCM15519_27050 [Fundidesulfovibrio butyratiphilus]